MVENATLQCSVSTCWFSTGRTRRDATSITKDFCERACCNRAAFPTRGRGAGNDHGMTLRGMVRLHKGPYHASAHEALPGPQRHHVIRAALDVTLPELGGDVTRLN